MGLFFNSIQQGMKDFGHTIATLVNTLLLTFVYIVGVGPTWLISKLIGKKFLQPKTSSTYWMPLNLKTKKKEEYLRQF